MKKPANKKTNLSDKCLLCGHLRKDHRPPRSIASYGTRDRWTVTGENTFCMQVLCTCIWFIEKNGEREITTYQGVETKKAMEKIFGKEAMENPFKRKTKK